jgi:hypothetical protein
MEAIVMSADQLVTTQLIEMIQSGFTPKHSIEARLDLCHEEVSKDIMTN